MCFGCRESWSICRAVGLSFSAKYLQTDERTRVSTSQMKIDILRPIFGIISLQISATYCLLYLAASVHTGPNINTDMSRVPRNEVTESLQEVVQTQQAHASEISLRIAALETNLTPLLGDAAGERRVGTQLLPQLQHTHTHIHTCTRTQFS